CISFCVLIGLRIVIELFVNLDEFTEHADLGTIAVIKNMGVFYAVNTTIYFRDFAGIITVLAAVFSLGKMVRANEFVAMMASGVSLKRVIAPVVFLSILLTALLIVDQEFVIPALSDELVRDEDDVRGRESYDVRFIVDEKGSLIFAQSFDVQTKTLLNPTILTRTKPTSMPIWTLVAQITATKAVYDEKTQRWNLHDGTIIKKQTYHVPEPIDHYDTDLTPSDIPIRRKAEYKTLLSWAQLADLQEQGPQRDLAQLYSQKHFRVTDPVINLAMLLISLPVLVCRDPKAMKSAVMVSFGLTAACMITTFLCKMFATEVVFATVMPQLWAWIPIFIFIPVAFIALDSMRT
ncbi:MAG: LptF/LptG family permease, partial [Planctomycetota bacterium]